MPVPFILLFAPNWNWILFANVLLGINQGLAWSMTVNMKIDLVGTKQRGLALGLNEFAGYVSVALVGFLTGYITAIYGLKPYPILSRNCISYSRTSDFLIFSKRYKKIYSIRNKKSKRRRRKKRQK